MAKKSNLDKYKNKKKSRIIHQKAENSFINTEKTININKKNADKVYQFSFWQKYSKFLPLIVIVVTFLLFINAIDNEFLNWDDDRYITGNEHLKFTLENIKFFFTDFYFVMYIPLTMMSYMIDYSLVGIEHAWVYHLHNIILHLITTALVFFFIKKIFEKKNNEKYIYAFVVAILFGIHPLHVESVSWIAERKDVLYSMFFMSSLLTYLHFINTKKKLLLVLSFVFYLLSLFSKTQAVVLPLIMIAIDYYSRNFIDSKDKLKDFITFKNKEQWKIFAEKIPFFILSIIFGLIAIKASGTNEPFAESFGTNTKIAIDTGYSLIEKLLLISYSLFLYVTELIVPFKQSTFHPYPFDPGEMPGLFYVFPLFSISFIAFFIWAWIKQKKEIVFGLLFFILNIFIVLHIKNFIISEHYLYLPAIGGSIILTFFAVSMSLKYKKLTSVILIISLVYFSFLSVTTIQRNNVFSNSYTFWNDVTEKYPQVVVAYYNRGNYLQKQGDFSISENKDKALDFYNEAILDYDKAIELHAANLGALSNRGITLAKIGKYQIAIEDFNRVVKIDSTYGNVYSNRGNVFGLLGKWTQAIADYNKAIQLKPNYIDALYNRGIAFSNINKNREAINDFNRVLQFDQNKSEVYRYRGLSYFFIEKIDSAIVDFNFYLKLYPNQYNLIYYRGLAYEKKDLFDLANADFENLKNNFPQIIQDILSIGTNFENQADAFGNVEQYQKALELFNNILKIDPNSSIAYSRIGVLKGKMGNMTAAFVNLNLAIELDANNAQAYADRGYAYSIIGNSTKAMSDYNFALDLNTEDFVTYYNRAILFENSNQYQKALDDLNTSLSLKNDYAFAYSRRAIVNYNLKNYQNACRDWTKALELGVENANNYLKKYCQ